ncbi:MAG: hypothetical protein ABIY51_09865 [Ferruginibacter sp.]
MQKYYIKGFIVKLLGGIFFALLVYYYYGVGDTMSYFRDSIRLRELLSEGKISFYQILTYDYEYFHDKFDLLGSVTESGFVVTKISFLLSYLSFSRFLIVTILASAVFYVGMFRLFRTFVAIVPTHPRFIAWIVLYFPSIAIYGSGIFKEPIAISALGWLIYYLHKSFIQKKFSFFYIIYLVAAILIIFIVKPYIIIALLIPFLILIILSLVEKVKSPLFKTLTLPILVVLIVALYSIFSGSISNILGGFAVDKLGENIKELQKSYGSMNEEDAGSNFDIGNIEPNLSSLISKLPAGFVATLYRPFIWETRKIIMFFSALESLFILIFTLYVLKRTGPIFFIRQIFSERFVAFFIFYSIIFAGIVGVSTMNFGTLARYRIPVIPFYLMGLLLIMNNHKSNDVKIKALVTK